MSVEYKEFKIGDLFNVQGTKSKNKSQIKLKEEGTYEFIGRTTVKNGVQGYVEEFEYEPNKGGTISISQVGTIVAQYRENPYYTSQNIAKAEPIKYMSKEVLHYIETLINKGLNTMGFVGYVTPKLKDIKELEIKLPITDTGDPDWDYMETYMRNIEEESEHIIEMLNSVTLNEGGGFNP